MGRPVPNGPTARFQEISWTGRFFTVRCCAAEDEGRHIKMKFDNSDRQSSVMIFLASLPPNCSRRQGSLDSILHDPNIRQNICSHIPRIFPSLLLQCHPAERDKRSWKWEEWGWLFPIIVKFYPISLGDRSQSPSHHVSTFFTINPSCQVAPYAPIFIARTELESRAH